MLFVSLVNSNATSMTFGSRSFGFPEVLCSSFAKTFSYAISIKFKKFEYMHDFNVWYTLVAHNFLVKRILCHKVLRIKALIGFDIK